MKKLSKKTTNLLEENGFRVCSINENRGGYCAEIETYRPAGEDVIVTIWYDGTDKGFILAFQGYAHDFDPDEHAEMWIEGRGENGVPSSIREILYDADQIKEMLCDMAEKLGA